MVEPMLPVDHLFVRVTYMQPASDLPPELSELLYMNIEAHADETPAPVEFDVPFSKRGTSQRTMGQFLNLHAYILGSYPYCVLPIAPAEVKSTSDKALETVSLVEWQLRYIVRHPTLYKDKVLWTFLLNKDWFVGDIPPPPAKLSQLPFARKPTTTDPNAIEAQQHIALSQDLIQAITTCLDQVSVYNKARTISLDDFNHVATSLGNGCGVVPPAVARHYRTMSTCLQSINRSLRAENTELLGDVRLCVSHIQSCMLGLAESVRVIEPLYLVVDDLCAKERTLLEQKQRLVDQEAESATEDTTDTGGGWSAFMKKVRLPRKSRDVIAAALVTISDQIFENQSELQTRRDELKKCRQSMEAELDLFYGMMTSEILLFTKILLKRQLQFNNEQIQHWEDIVRTTAADVQ